MVLVKGHKARDFLRSCFISLAVYDANKIENLENSQSEIFKPLKYILIPEWAFKRAFDHNYAQKEKATKFLNPFKHKSFNGSFLKWKNSTLICVYTRCQCQVHVKEEKNSNIKLLLHMWQEKYTLDTRALNKALECIKFSFNSSSSMHESGCKSA